ncbi:MAG: recombinase family protein [Conexivisphaerales archaeon]
MTSKATIIREILNLRDKGLGYKQIARKLRDEGIDLSPATIRNYLKNLQNTPLSSSSSSDVQETQKISTEVVEDIRPTNAEISKSNNNEVLSKSNFEEITKKQNVNQSQIRHHKKLKWENIFLISSIVFLVSEAIFILVKIILRLI